MKKELIVRPIRGEERQMWDQLMAAHHYLGLKQLVGESIRYVALFNGQWVALLGWTSAAYKSGSRDRWIGWDEDTRHKRLKFLANNSRFLMLPEVRVKNLASQILAANLKRLPGDWVKAYGHPVWLTETFIDPTRFAGTCYRAAGFTPLGQTRGFRRNAGYYYAHGNVKTILIRPLHQDVRQWLRAPFLSPALLTLGKNPLVDLNQLPVEGLLKHLEEVVVPRMPRGVRHQSATVLTVITCAVLSGAASYMDLGRWAAGLPQSTLKALGTQHSPNRRRFMPPSEATLRRVLQAVDMASLCRAVSGWLASQGLKSVAPVAIERLHSLRERTANRGDGHAQ
ncbi:MAG: Druantia anti-phage system protein DruA [Bacillota bacterium]